MNDCKSINKHMLMPCIHLRLGVIYVWERLSLPLRTDSILVTEGIEKAEPLNSINISIFFVEKDAPKNVELIRGTQGIFHCQPGGWGGPLEICHGTPTFQPV